MTGYEYEYYLVSQKRPNLNKNIIQLPRNDWIWILFGFPIMTEYKYHLASQKWSNSINKYKTNPYDSPDVTRVNEYELQFWRTK